MTDNKSGCCCGGHSHHHEHTHGGGCCGGHCHHHDHSHGGCCGSAQDIDVDPIPLDGLSEAEIQFLQDLVAHQYFPVAQFVLTSSTTDEFESVALSPVFVTDTKDTMEQIKNLGARLQALADKGFITLDYDIPLENYDYEEYFESEVFAYFKSTVEEAKTKPGFLGDTATIETGSMAPTDGCILSISGIL